MEARFGQKTGVNFMQVADLATRFLGCSNRAQTGPKTSAKPTQTPPVCTPLTGTRTGSKPPEKRHNVTLCVFSEVLRQSCLRNEVYICTRRRPKSSSKVEPELPSKVAGSGFGNISYIHLYPFGVFGNPFDQKSPPKSTPKAPSKAPQKAPQKEGLFGVLFGGYK